MNLIYIISFALTFIFSFALGIFTILHNFKSKVHWLWFSTSMGVALWAIGSVAAELFSNDRELSLMSFKVLDIGATLVMIFYLHFAIEFLNLKSKYKALIVTNYLLGMFFLFSLSFTTWIVVGVEQRLDFNYWEKGGILYPFYFIYCLLIFLISLYLQIKGYKTNEGLKRRQLVYLISALIVGFGGGMTVFFPELFNIYPIGIFFVFLYPILITYGIFLRRD